MPIVLHSAIVSALYMISQMLHYSRIVGGTLLGTWKETSYAAVPVGGLAYYVTPPSGLAHVVADPLHARLRPAAPHLLCHPLTGLDHRFRVLGQGRRQAARRPAPRLARNARSCCYPVTAQPLHPHRRRARGHLRRSSHHTRRRHRRPRLRHRDPPRSNSSLQPTPKLLLEEIWIVSLIM
ncbi:hypothetical protein PR202_ga01705 [Eleusine coracana subsp. coracana]|uniref:Uncharacterized protein n=1 Tax=Eleusine coracana subsp. coracana TaxID=191504 RepID=A0AAV5BJT7_ELECO|nr:hypothetical protein PR202_ga01018 [Eleusine coracana subsp. coracana]GJM85898.1 hypothetical protein PR202_ga01705 [Eleusine coracana subsp. coracana]